MMPATRKRIAFVLLGALLLAVPACLQSTSDPGSELNPQPLPPNAPEKTADPAPPNDQTGLGTPTGGGSSSGSSSGSSGTGANGDGGTDAGTGD